MKRKKIALPRWIFFVLLGVLSVAASVGATFCMNAPAWAIPIFIVVLYLASLAPLLLFGILLYVLIGAIRAFPEWRSILVFASSGMMVLLFVFFEIKDKMKCGKTGGADTHADL